jgi:hypothetical protein
MHLAAGGQRVACKLTSSALHLLARAKHLNATLDVGVTAPSGASSSTSAAVVLEPPPPAKRRHG